VIPLILGDSPLRYQDVVAVAHGRPAALGEAARARMKDSRATLERFLVRGDAIYGLSTGVSAIKTVWVAPDQQQTFQTLLLRAHRVGHGELAPPPVVRAAMLLRAAGLAVGAAGVRPEVADAFCRALSTPVTPAVHQFGSIGQADLSQLAEIGLALIGYGQDGAALRAAGYQPITLGPARRTPSSTATRSPSAPRAWPWTRRCGRCGPSTCPPPVHRGADR